MAAFDYRQALEIRDACARHRVKYLFIGKSGAILLGIPTRRRMPIYMSRDPPKTERGWYRRDLGFSLSAQESQEIRRGKDFIQLKNGPFDLDLIFARDGIEKFDDAWNRRVDIEGFPVCDIDDIVASKLAANRQKDKESLSRLISFRNWLKGR